MVFGALIHVAIADLFRTGEDPVEHFRRDWENLKEAQMRYKKRESWRDFHAKGQKLLEKFLAEEAPKIRKAFGIERKFELRVTVLIPRLSGPSISLPKSMIGQPSSISRRQAPITKTTRRRSPISSPPTRLPSPKLNR